MTARQALHVHPGNLFGGIETMLVNIARCRAAEWSHSFALCFPGRLADELAQIGASVSRLSAPRLSRPWSVRRARRDVARLLARQLPDAVIVHSPWSHVLFGSVARQAGVPLVLWLHGPLARRNWLDHLAARRKPDLLIANSRYTATATLASFPEFSGSSPAGIPVVHPPLDLPENGRETAGAAVRATLGARAGTTVIFQASRLEPWKGHRVLLDALGKIGASRDWVCWIAGGAQRPAEESYLRSLQDRARQLGIADRVRFLGQRTDVPQLMAAADVFCQPNESPEPFGLVFVEALAAGLPVVTADLGGAREILTPDCGILVKPQDEAGLAMLLTSLIDHPERRAALAANGVLRARELCDPPTQLRRLAHLLDGLRQ
ncbi:MAG TPA: glycosyltransferase [Gemmatimonadales bacterium]|nr:glycosyltransferase [Gemmatimonadales bacterium]